MENPGKYGQAGFDAENKFNQLHSSLMSQANASRAMVPIQKQAVDLFYLHHANPTDNDFNIMHALESPIGSPQSMITVPDPATGIPKQVPASIDYLSPNTPPISETQKNAAVKGALGGNKPIPSVDKGVLDPNTGFTKYTTTYGYTPATLQNASSNFANEMTRSYSGLTEYKKLAEDPNSIDALNKSYQSVYGATDANGKPNIVDNPYKAAQADFISRNQGQLSQLSTFKETPATRNKYATQQKELQNTLVTKRQQAAGGVPYDSYSPIVNNNVITTSKQNGKDVLGVVDSKGTQWKDGKPIMSVQDGRSQEAMLNIAKGINKYAQPEDLFYTPNPAGGYFIRDKTNPSFIVPADAKSILMQTAKDLSTGAATKKVILNNPNEVPQTKPTKSSKQKSDPLGLFK